MEEKERIKEKMESVLRGEEESVRRSQEEKRLGDVEKRAEIDPTEQIALLKTKILPKALAKAIVLSLPEEMLFSYCKERHGTDVRACMGKLQEAVEKEIEKIEAKAPKGVLNDLIQYALTFGVVPLFVGLKSSYNEIVSKPFRQFTFAVQKYFLEVAMKKARRQREALHVLKRTLASYPFVSLETKVELFEEVVEKVEKGEIDLEALIGKTLSEELISHHVIARWKRETKEGVEKTVEEIIGDAVKEYERKFPKEEVMKEVERIKEGLVEKLSEIWIGGDYLSLYENLILDALQEMRENLEEKLEGAKREESEEEGEELGREGLEIMPYTGREIVKVNELKLPALVQVSSLDEVREQYEKAKKLAIYEASPLTIGDDRMKEELRSLLREIVENYNVKSAEELIRTAEESEFFRKVVEEILEEDEDLTFWLYGEISEKEDLKEKGLMLFKPLRETAEETERAKVLTQEEERLQPAIRRRYPRNKA